MSKPLPKWAWWMPVPVIAAIMAAVSLTSREKPITLADVPPEVIASFSKLNRLQDPQWKLVSFESDAILSSNGQDLEARIATTIRNLGQGWVFRSEEWFERNGSGALHQERTLAFQNLFVVLNGSRNPAPFVHDILGNAGWYFDRAVKASVNDDGAFPEAMDSSVSVARSQVADSPPDSQELRTTRYDRQIVCRAQGKLDGRIVVPQISEQVIGVVCNQSTSEGFKRKSEYAYVTSLGLYFRLELDETDGKGSAHTTTRIRKLAIE